MAESATATKMLVMFWAAETRTARKSSVAFHKRKHPKELMNILLIILILLIVFGGGGGYYYGGPMMGGGIGGVLLIVLVVWLLMGRRG